MTDLPGLGLEPIRCAVAECAWDSRGTDHGSSDSLCRPNMPSPDGCLIDYDAEDDRP